MNIGETIKDDEQFRLLASFFVSKAAEPEEGYDPDFLEFYEFALNVITEESVETIIRLSGSPIERMFLGSLLLGSIKWFPYGIEQSALPASQYEHSGLIEKTLYP